MERERERKRAKKLKFNASLKLIFKIILNFQMEKFMISFFIENDELRSFLRS